MNNSTYSLTLIIPLYNEFENVAPLLDAIYTNLESVNYELIVVNDGSQDGTLGELRKHKNSQTKIINLNHNCGQSAAIKSGIDHSTNEIIVILDGDLQNDPSDITLMVNKLIKNQLDMVQGFRKTRHDNWRKIIPSRTANFLIRKLFQIKIHDIGCAIKVVKRDKLNGIYFFKDFHRYLALLIKANEGKVEEIEVKHHPRIYGQSKYNLSRTKEVIYHLWCLKTNKNKLPKMEYNIASVEV